jgi:hypothetical protein
LPFLAGRRTVPTIIQIARFLQFTNFNQCRGVFDMPLIGQSQVTSQHFGFRPPEEQPPPAWCTGLRAGSIPGGGMPNPNVFAQWWRDVSDPEDQFVVQIVAEDLIVGDTVRRTPTRIEAALKSRTLDSAQARKMASALTEAADLIES